MKLPDSSPRPALVLGFGHEGSRYRFSPDASRSHFDGSMYLKVLWKLGTCIEHALINAATDYEWTEDFGTCIKSCRRPTSHRCSVLALSCRKSDQSEGVELFRLMTKGNLKSDSIKASCLVDDFFQVA